MSFYEDNNDHQVLEVCRIYIRKMLQVVILQEKISIKVPYFEEFINQMQNFTR